MQRRLGIALALLTALLVGVLWASDDLDLPVDRPAPRKAVSDVPVIAAPDPPEAQVDEKPPTIYGTELPKGGSVIFVIDISGSMGLDLDSEWLDRLGRAKRELTRAIAALPESWRFDVIAYDCDPKTWAPFLVPADSNGKKVASNWVNALQPQGATGTGLAVGTALSMDRSNLLVVLLTDGDPNCNSLTMNGNVPAEVHRQDIRKWNFQRAVIDVFGIACAGGSPMEKFCQNVASDNGGVFVSVR